MNDQALKAKCVVCAAAHESRGMSDVAMLMFGYLIGYAAAGAFVASGTTPREAGEQQPIVLALCDRHHDVMARRVLRVEALKRLHTIQCVNRAIGLGVAPDVIEAAEKQARSS